VTGLLARDEAGREVPLAARRGVVLTSGGFAGNAEMGRTFLRLPSITPWGSPLNTGDGIAIAQKAGADLAHPYNYMASPGVGLAMPPYPTGEDALPREHRFITVGADGRRFIDETAVSRHGKTSIRGTLDFHPGVPMWVVFDEDGRLAGPLVLPREAFAVGWLKQIEGYRWSQDNSAEIERGWIVRADTVEELAEQLGIDPAGLVEQVAEYNATIGSGRDDPRFGRRHPTMSPIARPPFYGYAWGQVLITTLGGIRKDERARALDPDGTVIERLYAAGDVASTYPWALGGGMGLGDALAFGRVAGRQAASLPAP
jgi:succinate dehydrogenase/fumarate reductase flavoprotein subunit